MWEAKLNASRALQSGDNSNESSNNNVQSNNRLPITGHSKEVNIKTEMVTNNLAMK